MVLINPIPVVFVACGFESSLRGWVVEAVYVATMLAKSEEALLYREDGRAS